MAKDILEKIKMLMEVANSDSPSKEEVAKVIASIVKIIAEQKREFNQQISELERIVRNVKTQKGEKGDKPTAKELMTLITPLIPDVKDGEDGKSPDPIEVAKIVEEEIIDDLPKYGEKFRDGLEILRGDERLDKSAVKGIEEIEENIKKINITYQGHGGSGLRGIELYVDNVSKGLIQFLNLVEGTGVTLSHAVVGERHDVTISSTGGTGGGWETPVGTVDGSNTSFTVSNEPETVMADGATYTDGFGYTYLAGTITMDIAPKQWIRSSF